MDLLGDLMSEKGNPTELQLEELTVPAEEAEEEGWDTFHQLKEMFAKGRSENRRQTFLKKNLKN